MKHAKKSIFGAKQVLLIVSALLVLAVGTTATLAYLADKTGDLTNTFTPSAVTCQVNEQFNGAAKSNVTIKNTGDIAAYIRVAVVANWVKDGNVVQSTDVNFTLSTASGWFKEGDYYYYKKPVAAGSSTADLFIGSLQAVNAVTTAPDSGCKLKVDILAEAIQSEPAQAVIDAWGSDVNAKLERGSN